MRNIVTISSNDEVGDGLFVLRFRSGEIARTAQPGQFVNVRVTDSYLPLLRRPFSISRIAGSSIELVFNIVGVGTKALSVLKPGDTIDVLGPLGVPFDVREEFETALIVGGGVGVAPFPLLTEVLQREEKNIVSFIGARSVYQLYREHLKNSHFATDDGSAGFKGNVVQLLERYLESHHPAQPKIFGCGPTPMLKSLSQLAQQLGILCELSLEGDMACGIGLCQGCPVERANGPKKYALVCTEGPAFHSQDILLG